MSTKIPVVNDLLKTKKEDFISNLENELTKVAKEAANSYIQFLIDRKIKEVEKYRELTDELGKLDQVLEDLREIRLILAKTSGNADLEREVLEKLKSKLR